MTNLDNHKTEDISKLISKIKSINDAIQILSYYEENTILIHELSVINAENIKSLIELTE